MAKRKSKERTLYYGEVLIRGKKHDALLTRSELKRARKRSDKSDKGELTGKVRIS